MRYGKLCEGCADCLLPPALAVGNARTRYTLAVIYIALKLRGARFYAYQVAAIAKLPRQTVAHWLKAQFESGAEGYRYGREKYRKWYALDFEKAKLLNRHIV